MGFDLEPGDPTEADMEREAFLIEVQQGLVDQFFTERAELITTSYGDIFTDDILRQLVDDFKEEIADGEYLDLETNELALLTDFMEFMNSELQVMVQSLAEQMKSLQSRLDGRTAHTPG